METDKRVSVVIPTKNAGRLFREVLEKIRSQEGVRVDLVVVDSGSSDGTVALAQEFGARVEIIPPSAFNHGLTRDLGIGMSEAEFVVLMTQDAVPGDSRLLRCLIEPFSDPRVGGCYARQVARPEHDVLTRRNLELAMTGRRQSEVRSLGEGRTLADMAPFERYAMCNFDNVCSAVRKAAWEKNPFGRVDFAEDIEWSRKALEQGWKIAYVAESHVVHSHDRPLRYDFRRSYVTHRKLYEQYGMAIVPTFRHALKVIAATVLADVRYLLRHEKNGWRKLALLVKIPFLNVASVMGQYLGARDERMGRGKSFAGI